MPEPEELPPDWEEMEKIGERWDPVLRDTCFRCFARLNECICLLDAETETTS